MKKLTSKKVQEYFEWRSSEDLKHCPNCIALACNEAAEIFSYNKAIDLMKLVFFNDPIPELHTHSYTFHTATGRHIVETIKEYYYNYEKN